MVGIAQWLERFPVEEEVARSTRVTHPKSRGSDSFSFRGTDIAKYRALKI